MKSDSLALRIAILGLVGLVLGLVLAKRAVTYHDCEMTFMSSKYTKIPDAPGHTLYQLYRYEDNNYHSASDSPEVVVLFVAGSGGSYSQGRSLGSTLIKHMADKKEKPQVGMYTLDLKGEMNAFLPGSVVRQQKYLEEVIEFLYKKHSRKIIVVGHSMGGYLTCRLKNMVALRIVLSAPIKKLPIPNILGFWKSKFDASQLKDLVSIGSSFWDVQVPPEYSQVQEGSFVRANEMVMSWSNPNHVSIVWENSLLRAVVDYIFEQNRGRAADYFLNDKLLLNALGSLHGFAQDYKLLREDSNGYFASADTDIRLLTNMNLGKDFEVESDCAQARIVPGTSFPETAFRGKTKTIIPTLLTYIYIPKSCMFRYYKKTDGYLRLNVHPRNEEYFRELPPYMGTLDGGQRAVKALKGIRIFDVATVSDENAPIKDSHETLGKSVKGIQYKVPWYCKRWCILNIDIAVEKDLEANDVVVIRAKDDGVTYLRSFERIGSFTFPLRGDHLEIDIEKSFEERILMRVRVDYLQSIVDVLLKNHAWFIRGLSAGLVVNSSYLLLGLSFVVLRKGVAEALVFAFGALILAGLKIPKPVLDMRTIISMALPYPFAIAPILVQIGFKSRRSLLYLLPFIYDLVAVVCVVRDIVEAKAYLPYLNFVYNLPLAFFFIHLNQSPLSGLPVIAVVLLELHPSWIPILCALISAIGPKWKK